VGSASQHAGQVLQPSDVGSIGDAFGAAASDGVKRCFDRISEMRNRFRFGNAPSIKALPEIR
jgi:hypothetical protein